MPPAMFSVRIRASEHHYRSNYERSTKFTSKLNWLPILVLFQTIYQPPDAEKLLVHSSHIRTLKQFKLFLFAQEKIISFGGNLWPSMNGGAHTQNFSSESERERESKSSSRELTRKHQVILISAMWGSKNALKKFFCSVRRVENTLGTNSRFIAAAAARFI